MLEFVGSPIISILLLAVLGLEALILFYLWSSKIKGIPPGQIISFLGAGAAFSAALGFALSNLDPIWISLSLIAAFIFHIIDLWQRWQP